jgi:transposase InsO family protein
VRRNRGAGVEYVHIAVDDHSRYACVEALPDQTGATAAAFLERALALLRRRGVAVCRVLTDNCGNLRSHVFQRVAHSRGVALCRTRPYRPQTNGKAEALNKILQAEWAYARRYRSNPQRLRAAPLALPLQSPPSTRRHRRGGPRLTPVNNAPGKYI